MTCKSNFLETINELSLPPLNANALWLFSVIHESELQFLLLMNREFEMLIIKNFSMNILNYEINTLNISYKYI